VTLAIGTNPGGGTLSGTKTVTVSSGVATFTGLSIDLAGNGYTLIASSGTLTEATSDTFNIVASTASKLVFTLQPGGASGGSILSTQPEVTVEDALGNIETSDSSTQVTLTIGTNPGGGTLSGTKTVTVSNGVAIFTGLSIDKAGTGYTLTASSSPSYTSDTSNPFDITAGTASKLVGRVLEGFARKVGNDSTVSTTRPSSSR